MDHATTQAGRMPLEAFYFCFGRWDAVVVAEFASRVDVSSALMAIGRTVLWATAQRLRKPLSRWNPGQ